MRQVMLDGRNGPCADAVLRDKLAGHLNARLAEYGEEGITSILAGPGKVAARFNGMTGQQAAQALAQGRVYARAEGDRVCFLIGPGVTFEDLDYVQCVAAGML